MLVIKQVTKENNGDYTTEFSLSADQMNFLLTYAINTLVAKGLAVIEDTVVSSEGSTIPTSFLENSNPEDLIRA